MKGIGYNVEGVMIGGSYTNWTKRFGLTKNPFKDTLDSDLFFRTSQHEEALIKIMIAIEDRHALILLTGPSGTGKTMVSQMVLRTLDLRQYMPLFIYVYPGMGKASLLSAILQELGEKNIPRYAAQQLSLLHDIMMKHHDLNKRFVIVIDEAHFLKAEALHLLRTLSNLETEKEKLVTVLLIAEDILSRRLDNNPHYASLKSRITFAMNLNPLSLEDTEQYVKYRLLKCKAPANVLEGDAFRKIHRLSKGIPRDINRLLYNGFIESMTMNIMTLTPEILHKVARKLGLCHEKTRKK